MKIALINKKGGVGKSTLALLLTMALRKGGHTVELRDYDAQGTAAQAMARWPITAAPSGVGHLIFDSPPSLTLPSTLAAIDAADLILVPTTSAPFDYWEADKSAVFALKRNPKAKVRMVLNKAKPHSSLTKVFWKQTESRPVPVLPHHLGDRPCYQHAAVLGWDALNPVATEELLTFTINILAL